MIHHTLHDRIARLCSVEFQRPTQVNLHIHVEQGCHASFSKVTRDILGSHPRGQAAGHPRRATRRPRQPHLDEAGFVQGQKSSHRPNGRLAARCYAPFQNIALRQETKSRVFCNSLDSVAVHVPAHSSRVRWDLESRERRTHRGRRRVAPRDHPSQRFLSEY